MSAFAASCFIAAVVFAFFAALSYGEASRATDNFGAGFVFIILVIVAILCLLVGLAALIVGSMHS